MLTLGRTKRKFLWTEMHIPLIRRRRRQRAEGQLLPLGINPSKSEIIRHWIRQFKFKFVVKTCFMETLIETRPCFKANHYLRSLHFYFSLYSGKWKNIRANFVCPLNWFCLFQLCVNHLSTFVWFQFYIFHM